MTSSAGRAVTDLHRRRQLAVRAQVVREVAAAWELFDWRSLVTSLPALVALVDRVVEEGRAASTQAALEYLARFRRVEGARGRLPDVPAPAPVEPRLLEATVRATALASVLRLVKLDTAAPDGLAPDVVRRHLDAGLVRLAGATSRLALDAGRDTVVEGVRRDPAARGWVRVTGGRACEWCLTAAATGPRHGPGFGSHDHCSCTAEPLFGAYVERPQVAAARRLVDQAGADDDPLNALRRALPHR